MTNNIYRKQLFLHLDGIVLIPTLISLKQIGILDFIYHRNSFALEDIKKQYKINEGYVSVALRTLLSIGLLVKEKTNTNNYLTNNQFNTIIKHINKIESFNLLIPYYLQFEELNDYELAKSIGFMSAMLCR